MRRLTVLSVAYPLAPVGPDAVGGSEQILTALDRALVAAGHRSIVLAHEGSSAEGELVTYPGPPQGRPIDEDIASKQRSRVQRALLRLLQKTQVDLIHMHGLDFHFYLPPPGPPVLATLHLPPDWYPPRVWECARPNTWLNCVSQHQVDHTWPNPRMLPPVPNGVPVAALGAVRRRKCGYALMLARICPEKGLHLALQAAHASGTALLIGGEIFPYPAHKEYFGREVAPLLDRRRRYVGPLGFEQKRKLLAGAKCLLIPSLVPETSSLVAMEAAACGTPVIAFRIGALPEVVEHGRTGFIVDDATGMEQAIGRIGEIDPNVCRAVARERFTLERMAETYLGYYGSLAGQRVHGGGLIAVLETAAELQALAPEWERLWRASPAATPFQSPAWLLPWWAQFGTAMPRVAIERHAGTLTGVLPLYVLDEPGERKLLPVGAGTTDYLEGLGDPGPLVPAALARARVDGVHHCDLIEIPPSSALLDVPCPPGWQAHWHDASPCPVLQFPAIPARIRRKLRMARHRADRAGGWSTETAGPDTVQDFLAELIRLHQARWVAQGETGTLASAPVLAFHHTAAPALLEAGVLRLQILHHAGKVAAATLALLAPGRIFFYLSGFDDAHAFVSPGMLLLGAMLEQAMAEGRAEAHLLRGREPYKYAWGATDRLNKACRLTPA